MAFTIFLISTIAQRLLHISSESLHFDWFGSYYRWIKRIFNQMDAWSVILTFVVCVIPIPLVVSIVLGIIYHTLGIIVYYILSLFIFWYCIDANRCKEDTATTAGPLFISIYQKLFALTFWFALVGMFGLLLYAALWHLQVYFEDAEQIEESQHQLLVMVNKSLAVLDWVPSRLLGLTFALVGHFPPTFTVWLKNVWSGLENTQRFVVDCALTTLNIAKDENANLTTTNIKSVNGLIDRVILVWLIVMALFTIGFWLG